MAPNPRYINAYNAMRTLGIPEDEVKPIVEELLSKYKIRWEIIEENNYQALVDAYFESKEQQQAEGKRETPAGEMKPSQASTGDMKPTASSRTLRSSSSEIKNMPNDHDKKELITPKNKKPKLHLGPVSSHFRGPCDDTRENRRYRLVSDIYLDSQKKDDNPASNTISRTCEGSIDIASSPLGEVKISLNCDVALGHPNFRIPNLGDVMKSMEEKVKRLWTTAESQLSMVKLLDDLCGNFWKLGMSSYRKCSNVNGINSHKKTCVPEEVTTHHENSSDIIISDITKGSENVKISLSYQSETQVLPKFNYIPNSIIYQSANVNISFARIVDEDCCSDCSGDCLSLSFPCACSKETGGEFAYTPEGLLKEEFLTLCMSMKEEEPQDHHFVYCEKCPLERTKKENVTEQCKGHLVRKFIKECWKKCGCDMKCGNRVVQRGIRCQLQVFVTHEGKGWGIRTLEDLPKGSFVFEYVGEILTNAELHERILQNRGKDKHTYPVTLDADWGSEGVLKDEEALCLDATYNGNVGRFVNHRCCDANLIDIPVEIETPDRHYYHLALFTNRKVNAYEELTWDYGIDFDDHEHPIKAFKCCCGSAFCRDKKQKGRTRSSKSKKHRD